jgi:hypothetical protein
MTIASNRKIVKNRQVEYIAINEYSDLSELIHIMNNHLTRSFFGILLTTVFLNLATAEVEIVPVSPRMIEGDETEFFDQKTSGLQVVSIGAKTYLQVNPDSSDDELINVQWAITTQPDGSSPQLVNPNDALTAIIPDLEGNYELQVTAQVANSITTIDETVQLVAATYTGVGGRTGNAPGFPDCALCHSDVNTQWVETHHANVMKAHLNGERSDQYDASCFECHTNGFLDDATIANGGFNNAVNSINADLNEIAERVNDAYIKNNDNDPDNDIFYYDTFESELKVADSVQCEMCHGPGSKHLGNVNNIGKRWDARMCAQCHDAMGHNNTPYPFDSSSHKNIINAGFAQTSCGKCHAAEAFVRLNVNNDETTAPEDSDPHSVSCVACHDPHDKTLPKQLRIYGDVVLESGYEFTDGGLGGICASCHQSRVNSDLEEYIETSTRGPHHGTQADVMLGVNLWTFGREIENPASVHKDVVEDTCSACHLARIPENGWSVEKGILLGGHSFKVTNDMDTDDTSDDISNVNNACLPCHMTISSVNRVMVAGEDYDANGKVEGIQTEVKGLLTRVADALIEKYPSIEIDDEGHLTIPSSVFNQMTFNEKAAVHNYRMFLNDNSFGIHNGRMTVQVLQLSHEAISTISLKVFNPNVTLIGTSTSNHWKKLK